MRKLTAIFSIIGIIFLCAGVAHAWHARGNVFCDVDQNELISSDDIRLEGVRVIVVNEDGNFSNDGLTPADTYFKIEILDTPDKYIETLDISTLPFGVVFVIPPFNEHRFETTSVIRDDYFNWLIDAPECRGEEAGCWLTMGGVKFEPISGLLSAQVKSSNGKGPKDSLGGNINPACTPDKGNLNHVAHSAKLHFQGRDIVVTRCGNIPGFDGSESPVTPFSFIEFEGPGTLSALGGCNDSICDDLPLDCSFTGRIEDRNEPGSKEAIDPQGGALIDRYHIHVSCPGYPDALVFAGISPDPARDGEITEDGKITGGNMQMHISSCP